MWTTSLDHSRNDSHTTLTHDWADRYFRECCSRNCIVLRRDLQHANLELKPNFHHSHFGTCWLDQISKQFANCKLSGRGFVSSFGPLYDAPFVQIQIVTIRWTDRLFRCFQWSNLKLKTDFGLVFSPLRQYLRRAHKKSACIYSLRCSVNDWHKIDLLNERCREGETKSRSRPFDHFSNDSWRNQVHHVKEQSKLLARASFDKCSVCGVVSCKTVPTALMFAVASFRVPFWSS